MRIKASASGWARTGLGMRYLGILLLALGYLGFAQPAMASGVNLVTNGDFDTTTNGTGEMAVNSSNVELTTGTDITDPTGWYSTYTASNAGYPFLFVVGPNTADTTGFGDAWDGDVQKTIWGPGDGSANGFTNNSPTGGNFLISDGDYHRSAIDQNISGLVVGTVYNVTFNWAAGQWSGNTGITTEQWQVSLGDLVKATNIVTNPSEGFSGWYSASFNFEYDGSSDVLSFLALGTPSGEPPMLLLDGVSMVAMPEPGSLGLLATGMFGLVLLRRRKMVLSHLV